MPWTETLSAWVIHSAIVSLAVLLVGSGAVLMCRQPARRVSIIQLVLAACLITPWLGMIPGYPRLHLGGQAAAAPGEGQAASPARAEPPAGSPALAIADPHVSARVLPPEPAAPTADVPDRFFDASWIVAVYVLGVVAGTAWWLVGLLGLARIMWTTRPAPQHCRELLAQTSGRRANRVALLASRRVRQPFAFALGRPVIVLPDDLCADEQSLRWSLAHEWTHIERHDFRAWIMAGLARVAFFYNPLVWWLRRQLRLNQDFLADAQAARHAPQPEDYAEFLTGLAKAGSLRLVMAGLGMGSRRSDLYWRVLMLLRTESLESHAPRLWAVAATIAALATAGVVPAITAGPRAAAEHREKISGPASAAGINPETQQNEKSKENLRGPAKTITGIVVDEGGRPVSDAQVWMATAATDREVTAAAHTRTGKEGRFTLELPGGEYVWLTIWGLAPGFGLSAASAREALSDEKGGTEVRVVLRPEGRTEFLILSPDGKRLPGAFVGPYHFRGATLPKAYEIVSREVYEAVGGTTGADGRVSLPELPRDGLQSVRVVSDVYGTWIQQFPTREAVPPETTIRLPPAGRVVGRLIAPDPKLVRGVGIVLATSGSPFQGTTLPALRDTTMPSGPATSGGPQASARQTARAFPSGGQAWVVSDEEGRFVVPAIAEGTLALRVQIDKHLPYRAKVPRSLVVANPDPTRVEIHILPAVRVEGVLRIEGTGQPLAGADVLVPYDGSVTTDALGKFTTFVLPGNLTVQTIIHRDGWRLTDKTIGKTYSVPEGVKEFNLPPLEATR